MNEHTGDSRLEKEIHSIAERTDENDMTQTLDKRIALEHPSLMNLNLDDLRRSSQQKISDNNVQDIQNEM